MDKRGAGHQFRLKVLGGFRSRSFTLPAGPMNKADSPQARVVHEESADAFLAGVGVSPSMLGAQAPSNETAVWPDTFLSCPRLREFRPTMPTGPRGSYVALSAVQAPILKTEDMQCRVRSRN